VRGFGNDVEDAWRVWWWNSLAEWRSDTKASDEVIVVKKFL
jgi:hypothetical protein